MNEDQLPNNPTKKVIESVLDGLSRQKEEKLNIQQNRKLFIREAKPIIDDLRKAGYHVELPDSIFNYRANRRTYVDVLLRHINLPYSARVKLCIVEGLSVPAARNRAAKPLLEEYYKTSKEDPSLLRWAIGNVLSLVADETVFEEIVGILKDKSNGKSREMFALALARMKNPQAVDVLIDMLEDEEIVGHAIIGLRKLKAARAKNKIIPLTSHPKTWIRKEAKKFVEKF